MPDGDQAQRSRHHKSFLEPDAADLLLADGARPLRERLANAGVPLAAVEENLSVLGNQQTMEAALTWYRARGAIRAPLGPIRVPNALHLGRRRRHRRADGSRRHGRFHRRTLSL